MKPSTRMTMLCLPVLLLMFASALSAQWQKKPYGEWSQKEVMNVLNNSPWAQSQEVADTDKMFDSSKTLGANPNRVAETARTSYRIRFFSAKPTRQALCRLIEIKQKGKVSEELAAQLKGLVDAEFKDYVVLTLVIDTSEAGNQTGPSAAMLQKQVTAQLKADTWVLAKGGERVFLQEYQIPRHDGFGARFLFPRNPGGKPLLGPDSSEILFHTKLDGGPTLIVHFKVKDMTWEGKLEY
jgi:hypothetical protein